MSTSESLAGSTLTTCALIANPLAGEWAPCVSTLHRTEIYRVYTNEEGKLQVLNQLVDYYTAHGQVAHTKRGGDSVRERC